MKLSAFLIAVLPLISSAHEAEEAQTNLRRRLDELGPTITVSGVCFSEVSQVQVAGKGPVAMKDLQTGDAVLTGSHIYQPVYSWGHYEPNTVTEFLSIQTSENKKTPLEITGTHMVFLEGKINPVRADSIKVGDVLRGENAGAKITNIKTIEREGLYAPLTAEGSIVVDGIVASSYISMQSAAEFMEFQGGKASFLSQHQLVHMILSPFRMMCMGVSSNMCNQYNHEGMPHYVGQGIRFGHWADEQNLMVQGLLFAALFPIFSASVILESTFGPSMAPLALLVAAVVYVWNRRSTRTTKAKTV